MSTPGSPSQLELFEHKPELNKLPMQDCPAAFLEGKRFAFIKGVPKILAGQFSFRQYGAIRRSDLGSIMNSAASTKICRGLSYYYREGKRRMRVSFCGVPAFFRPSIRACSAVRPAIPSWISRTRKGWIGTFTGACWTRWQRCTLRNSSGVLTPKHRLEFRSTNLLIACKCQSLR